MFKVLTFLKRRPGLSMEEFIEQYENGHAKLGEKILGGGNAVRQFRRYLYPFNHALTEEGKEPEYDAIMEMWFEDEAQFERTMALLSNSENVEQIVDSGAEIFDRSKLYMCSVVESEADLSGR